ncbi:Serine protease, partial [Globisporangium splendens]
MPDGGIVSLDWALPVRKDGSITPLSEIDRTKRTVLIHPGLTGGSSEHYIRSAVHCLHKAGWQAVVMNARGCAQTPLKTPKFFCIAYTDDFRYTAKYLAEKYAFRSEAFIGLGFSMGANVLVKYLGEEKDQTPLTGAISIGNPFDVVKCSGNIDATLFNRLTYGKALNTNLLELVFKKSNAHEIFQGYPGIDLESLRQAKSLFEFDDRFTRILFGYKSVPEFYEDASSVTRLEHVAVPLLCINAEDDPISITIPSVEQIHANTNVILCVTKSGGHLAFYEGSECNDGEEESGLEKPVPAKHKLPMWSSRVIAEFAESVRIHSKQS